MSRLHSDVRRLTTRDLRENQSVHSKIVEQLAAFDVDVGVFTCMASGVYRAYLTVPSGVTVGDLVVSHGAVIRAISTHAFSNTPVVYVLEVPHVYARDFSRFGKALMAVSAAAFVATAASLVAFLTERGRMF